MINFVSAHRGARPVLFRVIELVSHYYSSISYLVPLVQGGI